MNLEYGWALDKNRDKPRICFPSLRLALHSYKAVESELSTALYECKAVARCATRKTDTAINRIKTSETHKLRIENTSGRKQNKNRWGSKTVVTSRNIDTAITIPVIYFIRSKADYLANQRGNP